MISEGSLSINKIYRVNDEGEVVNAIGEKLMQTETAEIGSVNFIFLCSF